MTLSVRNGVLALGFGVILVFTLAYSGLAVSLISQEGWGATIGPVALGWLFVETAVALGISLFGFLLLRRSYHKSSAPELFFFALFFVTLAAESLLVVQAWLHFHGLPSWFSGMLTRTIWAFRFTGLFLLFCGSLFAFEFPYRKYGNLILGAVAAGIFLAVMVPLHTNSARNHLLFAMGDTPGVVLVTTVFAVVAGGNFVLGTIRPDAPDRGWSRALAAIFFLGGWTIAATWAPWGTLLTLPGLALAGWKAEQTGWVR